MALQFGLTFVEAERIAANHTDSGHSFAGQLASQLELAAADNNAASSSCERANQQCNANSGSGGGARLLRSLARSLSSLLVGALVASQRPFH